MMLSNKPIGIAGAAILGTVALLGTNAANAVINLDETATMKSSAAVIYAKETILESHQVDETTYYVVDGGDRGGNCSLRGAG